MWAIMVVPASDIPQGPSESFRIRNGFAGECPLHGADEPFHATVLPETVWISALMLNTEEPQAPSTPLRREDRFIVCPHKPWSAISLHRLHEFLQQPQRRLIRQLLELRQARLA